VDRFLVAWKCRTFNGQTEEQTSDFRIISALSRRLRARDVARLHSESVAWLISELPKRDPTRLVTEPEALVIISQQDRTRLAALAEDLPYVWSHEATSIELKKRLVRCALTSITAETVEDPPRIKLLLHWTGGVHTSMYVKRNLVLPRQPCPQVVQNRLGRQPAIRAMPDEFLLTNQFTLCRLAGF